MFFSLESITGTEIANVNRLQKAHEMYIMKELCTIFKNIHSRLNFSFNSIVQKLNFLKYLHTVSEDLDLFSSKYSDISRAHKAYQTWLMWLGKNTELPKIKGERTSETFLNLGASQFLRLYGNEFLNRSYFHVETFGLVQEDQTRLSFLMRKSSPRLRISANFLYSKNVHCYVSCLKDSSPDHHSEGIKT